MAQPASASAALQTFLSGQGDVLLDYEDDGLYAKSQGEPVNVITPPQTILIQNPIAVTKTASPAAKAFLAYLLSPAGQTVWGKQGYRPVLPSVAAKFNFPKPKTLFTINKVGGWTVGQHEVLRPDHGHRGQDRAVARRLHRQLVVGGEQYRRAPSTTWAARGRRRARAAAGRGRSAPPPPRPWPRPAGWSGASAAPRSPSPTCRSWSCCRWPRW